VLDHSSPKPIRAFESGSILVYLAEKFDALLPRPWTVLLGVLSTTALAHGQTSQVQSLSFESARALLPPNKGRSPFRVVFARRSRVERYPLRFISHDWNDEDCVWILKNCRHAMWPNSKSVVVESLLGRVGQELPDDVVDMQGAIIDLHRSVPRMSSFFGKQI
jgi:hypothetical protein